MQPLPLPQRPLALVMGDVNRDGKMDLAVATTWYYSIPGIYYNAHQYYYGVNGKNVDVLLGNGDGTFSSAQTVPLNNNASPTSITMGNFNGDAFPDLAATDDYSYAVSVLMNAANWSPPAPPPSSFSVSGFATSTTAGTPGNFTVTALNADGTVDTGYTGTVRFSSTDGQFTLPAYTFTAADAGKHIFSATLKTAGTQSITVSDSTTSSVTASETGITVTPAAASHFAVSAPTSSTAGSALSVTVTALDPYNNTASGYGGIVDFT
ncbi:MAG TPA: VCBS repeat-containing protein, partial [Pirellulales bacterium]|nr:VCBS repeat-containing protein [Pirellulales bacterium]